MPTLAWTAPPAAERDSVAIGPWQIEANYRAGKFKSCVMSRVTDDGVEVRFVRDANGLTLTLHSPRWELGRGKSYPVQLVAGSTTLDADAAATANSVSTPISDDKFLKSLGLADQLEVKAQARPSWSRLVAARPASSGSRPASPRTAPRPKPTHSSSPRSGPKPLIGSYRPKQLPAFCYSSATAAGGRRSRGCRPPSRRSGCDRSTAGRFQCAWCPPQAALRARSRRRSARLFSGGGHKSFSFVSDDDRSPPLTRPRERGAGEDAEQKVSAC